MPSGLDVEPAGGSVVRYCLFSYLLRQVRGHQVAVLKHDMGALSWLNGKDSKEHPRPSLADL